MSSLWDRSDSQYHSIRNIIDLLKGPSQSLRYKDGHCNKINEKFHTAEMPYKKRPVVKKKKMMQQPHDEIWHNSPIHPQNEGWIENMENAHAFIWTEGKKQETDLWIKDQLSFVLHTHTYTHTPITQTLAGDIERKQTGMLGWLETSIFFLIISYIFPNIHTNVNFFFN